MSSLRRGSAWRWLLVALWMGAIFYMSSRPDLPHYPQDTVDVVLKKLGHVIEYGTLAALVFWAWEPPGARSTRSRVILGAFAIAALYAVSDEIHQRFVPGRNSQLLDVGFDLVGACLALLLAHRFFPSLESPPER
jgi:VanZ family protein